MKVAIAATKAAQTSADDESLEAVVARQREALKLMTLIVDDIRAHLCNHQAVDRIVQHAIEYGDTGYVAAEKLERETWGATETDTGA